MDLGNDHPLRGIRMREDHARTPGWLRNLGYAVLIAVVTGLVVAGTGIAWVALELP